jgi:hypothetical protein
MIVLLGHLHRRLRLDMMRLIILLLKNLKDNQEKEPLVLVTGMNLISKNDVKFNGKGVEIITHEYGSMLYYVMVKGHKTLRSTTTNSFIKMYPTGTYIVIVKGHAFTIKNGCVIGNLSDAKQIRKHIISAWKIG